MVINTANTVLKGHSPSTHSHNQWIQIDLQVTFAMLESAAMVTKGLSLLHSMLSRHQFVG